MNALMSNKTKRKLKKVANKLLELLIELGRESPIAPVLKPRKRFYY